MKLALVTSQCLCLFSLVFSCPRRYKLTLIYLLLAIPASIAFRSDEGWLRDWYVLLTGPVLAARLAAGIEVYHRQSEGFLYWCRLTGTGFVVAGMFAALSWVQSPHPDTLQSFVELRRLLQVWLGAFFVVIEGFWISQGGGILRRVDQVAFVFGLLCLNHAVVGVLKAAGFCMESVWFHCEDASWGVDAACYLVLAIIFRLFRGARQCPPRL